MAPCEETEGTISRASDNPVEERADENRVERATSTEMVQVQEKISKNPVTLPTDELRHKHLHVAVTAGGKEKAKAHGIIRVNE